MKIAEAVATAVGSNRCAHGVGYDEHIEVFGSKGMVESRRQRFRGVSRYIISVIKSSKTACMPAGLNVSNKAITTPWTLLPGQ
jgi:hypothetical protein